MGDSLPLSALPSEHFQHVGLELAYHVDMLLVQEFPWTDGEMLHSRMLQLHAWTLSSLLQAREGKRRESVYSVLHLRVPWRRPGILLPPSMIVVNVA